MGATPWRFESSLPHQIVTVMETKRVVLNEDGTLDSFLVSEDMYNLIMGLSKHHKWVKDQTLSDKLTLNVYIPEDNVTISITW